MRPYILWAHIQWLDESDAKPHIVIQNGPKTLFPPAFQSHSVVTFNISTESVKGLNLDENGLSFSARFSGKEFKVYAPLDCLMQIHSADQTIRIGLQRPPEKEPVAELQRAEVESKKSPMAPKTRSLQDILEETDPPNLVSHKFTSMSARVKPTLVSGGTSDGIKRGKLSLVIKEEE